MTTTYAAAPALPLTEEQQAIVAQALGPPIIRKGKAASG